MITLGRQTINSADAETLARKVSEHLLAKGGKITEIEILPTPRGLLIGADIHGQVVVVLCYSFNLINYESVADALMREYQATLKPLFPDDADIIGIHRSTN